MGPVLYFTVAVLVVTEMVSAGNSGGHAWFFDFGDGDYFGGEYIRYS